MFRRPLTAAEKIALARTCIDALNARDFDRYFTVTQPDYEVRIDPNWPGGGVTVGRPELMRFYDQFFDQWDDVRYELRNPTEVGERLLSHDRWVGRTTPDGPEEGIEFYSVASFRDGLIAHVDLFLDRARALEFARSA